MPVHIRPACALDLPDLADLAAQAMSEDELFSHLCPHRYKNYPDFRYAFLRRLKKRLVTPGNVVIVAVEKEGFVGCELICGYAVWERNGRGADQWNNNAWTDALERTLLAIEDRYLALISPDRSADPQRLAHYLTSVVDCFPFSNFPNNWFLSTVAVDPLYQRRGIGQQLVQWGLQQAQQENVPVGLEASLKGFGLYEKLGFRTVNKMDLMPGITIRAMLHDGGSLSEKLC